MSDKDTIYRQDAKDAVDMALDTIDHVPEWVYDILLNSLDKVPSAQPRKYGEWIEQDDCWDGIYYECSVCKDSFTLIDGNPSDNNYNFCPSCGADMRGDSDEN